MKENHYDLAIRNVRPACTNKESPPRVSPSKVTFAAHDDIRVAHASPKSASLSDVETFWDPNPTPKVLNDGSHPDVMHSSIPTTWTTTRGFEFLADGAAVAIPFAEVEAVCSRFANTLYGYFIGKRLAFPLVENYVKNTWGKYGVKRIQLHEDFFLFQFNTKEGMDRFWNMGAVGRYVREPLNVKCWVVNTDLKKAEITSAPVWVKFQHVPIVAYSEVGLSLISTQVGKPITLDSDELVVAIPKGKDMGHSLATVSIEYEWTPPRCSTCMIFGHLSKDCPKLPKETPVA
ncbi:zinc knuckle CX2CX4HX4C containing protein [Tanacetum coccineum]